MNGRQQMLVWIVAALVVALGIVATAWYANAQAQREADLKAVCLDEGGVWTYSGCAWSGRQR